MNCRFEYKNILHHTYCVLCGFSAPHKTQTARRTGFTLVEGMAAVTLLAFIGAGVWLIIEQCSISATDATQRMRAFEVARENMEKLLIANAVEESTEYGVSEQYPDISWQTTIETFYHPLDSKVWVRAVASADYIDSSGQTRTITLTNWLTELSDEQLKQLEERKTILEKLLGRHLIDSDELAAEYVGQTVDTIHKWVRNGMPTFEDAYIKPWLDLYRKTNGQPTDLEKKRLIAEHPELEPTMKAEDRLDQTEQTDTSVETETETQPTENADSIKLPENLDPAVRKQFEQLLKNR